MTVQTAVGVQQWSTTRSERNFYKANEFIPERWIDLGDERFLNDNKAALQPFSLGPRNCIGRVSPRLLLLTPLPSQKLGRRHRYAAYDKPCAKFPTASSDGTNEIPSCSPGMGIRHRTV